MDAIRKKLKFVVCSCSFKGSLSASRASGIMSQSIKKALSRKYELEIVEIPIADGGEGTVDCFLQSLSGERVYTRVLDPLQREIEAYYGIVKDNIAVIEMAAASGLCLINISERDPLRCTSYGTGQLIRSALDNGCRKIILGLGGSATNDCGQGLARALGVQFFDSAGCPVELLGGDMLGQIATIDTSKVDARLKECEFVIASDVNNPLCGLRGATYVFGPQKGVTDEMKESLDQKLLQFGRLLETTFQKPIVDRTGAGAAGGMGAISFALLNGKFNRGIDLLKEVVEFEGRIKGADYIFTGEGQIDDQTLDGKALLGVLESAKSQNIPVIAFAGGLPLDEDFLYKAGFQSIIPIVNRPMQLVEAIKDAEILLENAVKRVCHLLA